MIELLFTFLHPMYALILFHTFFIIYSQNISFTFYQIYHLLLINSFMYNLFLINNLIIFLNYENFMKTLIYIYL